MNGKRARQIRKQSEVLWDALPKQSKQKWAYIWTGSGKAREIVTGIRVIGSQRFYRFLKRQHVRGHAASLV